MNAASQTLRAQRDAMHFHACNAVYAGVDFDHFLHKDGNRMGAEQIELVHAEPRLSCLIGASSADAALTTLSE